MSDSTSAERFRQLLADELTTLKESGQQVFIPSGQIIFKEGDAGDGLYLVDEGLVEISAKAGENERRVLASIGPNTFFGEMAVFDDGPRSATAIAELDTRLTFVGRAAVMNVLEGCPPWMFSLVRELAARVRRVDRRYLDEVLQAERLSIVGRFAQSIVHDLKNPLNIIGMAGELAGAADATVDERTEAAGLIRKQVARLTNMINEVLEFTRGSSGAVALDAVDYGEFVAEALQELKAELAAKAVAIECTELPGGICIKMDRKKLLHVFFNLFNNAVDFMPGGGTITLRFQSSDRDVVTEVEDTGPGIAKEIAGRLFEPFATHGKTKGTGLGLAICKRIVEDHGGRMAARSEPGRGAVFVVSLPRT